MTRITKATLNSVADRTKAFAAAFPPHPRQQDFMDAAVALRAQALAIDAASVITPQQALTTASAEFEAALQAVIFPPSENRFYVIFAEHPASPSLAKHIRAAWEAANAGPYGDHPPLTFIAKT